MKSSDALHEFERMLKARGRSIDSLSASDGVEAMLDFYRTIRADDCAIDTDGDMLLCQWGTYDWGQGARFEFDITRQLFRDGADDDDIWQLSLTFVFPPNEIASGDRWCSTPDELDDFAEFVRAHAAYVAACQSRPARVELDFEATG
jgi:hypothetical protein